MMEAETIEQIHRMLKQASAFSDCAKYCLIELHTEIGIGKSHVVPAIVNFAFACEVYMKALLRYSGKSMTDIKQERHYLDRLWLCLEQSNKEITDRIRSRVMSVFDGNESFFSQMLKESSKSFEEWRYAYEASSLIGHPQFLRILCISLESECSELFGGKNESQ